MWLLLMSESAFSMSAAEIENAPSQETEREDYVSSDSSSESDIEDLCKEVLEDGEKEMILVPRSVSIAQVQCTLC